MDPLSLKRWAEVFVQSYISKGLHLVGTAEGIIATATDHKKIRAKPVLNRAIYHCMTLRLTRV